MLWGFSVFKLCVYVCVCVVCARVYVCVCVCVCVCVLGRKDEAVDVGVSWNSSSNHSQVEEKVKISSEKAT